MPAPQALQHFQKKIPQASWDHVPPPGVPGPTLGLPSLCLATWASQTSLLLRAGRAGLPELMPCQVTPVPGGCGL